jgi:hypothetical protein
VTADREYHDHVDESARKANERKTETDLVHGSVEAETAAKARQIAKQHRDGGR